MRGEPRSTPAASRGSPASISGHPILEDGMDVGAEDPHLDDAGHDLRLAHRSPFGPGLRRIVRHVSSDAAARSP